MPTSAAATIGTILGAGTAGAINGDAPVPASNRKKYMAIAVIVLIASVVLVAVGAHMYNQHHTVASQNTHDLKNLSAKQLNDSYHDGQMLYIIGACTGSPALMVLGGLIMCAGGRRRH
jgi:uncharacterized protein (TIGR03382 family)